MSDGKVTMDEFRRRLHKALEGSRVPGWLKALLRMALTLLTGLDAQLQEALKDNAESQAREAELKAENARLRKQLYGRKSEKSKQPRRTSKGTGRKKHGDRGVGASALDQATLPEQHVVHELPQDERVCPVCEGTDFRLMRSTEDSSEYKYIQASIVRVHHHRQKHACAKGCTVLTAPGPPRVLDGGRFHSSFYAQVVVQRSIDAIPFQRQAEILRRAGAPVSASTLCDLFHDAARVLEPVYELLLEEIRRSPMVHADETPQPVIDMGPARRAFVWTFASPTVAVFVHAHGRSGETPKKVLGKTMGTLVADAYSGYNAIEAPEARTRAGCLAHARRKFVEAEQHNPKKVAWLLKRIAKIYAVEAQARNAGIRGTPEHLALRQNKSKPVMEEIRAWLDKQKNIARPKSPFGKAVSYMDNQWERLLVFLDDASVPPDNNHAERLLRRIALGRKSSLFVADDDSGQRYAINMSIVATCRLLGINPLDYLTDILPKIADTKVSDLPTLLPTNWQPP